MTKRLLPLCLSFVIGATLATAEQPAVKPTKVSTEVPDTVIQTLDLPYASYGERKMVLDLYQPKGKGPFPAILLVHGGGWIGGNKESFRALGQHLAKRGYVTASISYRLATETPFPGAVNDCKAAVRWLRANAEKYHIDADRIGGVGGSAGGHLIGMVATSGPGKFEGNGGNAQYSSQLQAAVMMGSGVDQVARSKESPKPIKNCVIFFGGTLAEKPEVYAQGSPITHISDKTPPLLMLDGELDRPGRRYVEMRKRLDRLGVPNDFAVVRGAKHGQWNRNPFFQDFLTEIDTFMKRRLNPKQAHIQSLSAPYPSGGTIIQADPALSAILDPNAKVEKLATGFNWSEGPVWIAETNTLLFSDVPENKVYKWNEKAGISIHLSPSGFFGGETDSPEPGSNGLNLDADGNLVICQHGERRVARRNSDATYTPLASNYQGKKFNSPNDLVFHPNGDLYFTDPPWGLKGNYKSPIRELKFTGVYRRTPDGTVHLVSNELSPNGIALSPDNKILYVTHRGNLVTFNVAANGSTSANHKPFFNFKENGIKGGADGMVVHKNGTLFIGCLGGGIVIVSPSGKYLGMIRTNVRSANCDLDETNNTLYFMADAYIGRVKLKN